MLAAIKGALPLLRRLSGEAALPWLGRLAWLGVFVAGGWLLIGLAWQAALSPPPPPLPIPASPTETARAIAERRLLGNRGKATAAGGQQAEAASTYRLTGVIAGNSRFPGLAVLQGDGEPQPKVFAAGADIAPGVRLLRVERNQAVLFQEGRELLVRLPAAGMKPAARVSNSLD